MDEKYVGTEGCEDLWELLRSVNQTKGLLEGWKQYYEQAETEDKSSVLDCIDAIGACEDCFASIVLIYSRVFNSLQ